MFTLAPGIAPLPDIEANYNYICVCVCSGAADPPAEWEPQLIFTYEITCENFVNYMNWFISLSFIRNRLLSKCNVCHFASHFTIQIYALRSVVL